MPIVRALVSSIIDAFLRFLTFLTFFSLSLSLSSKTTRSVRTREDVASIRHRAEVHQNELGTTRRHEKRGESSISSNVLDAHENTAESERENWIRRVWDFDLERSTTRDGGKDWWHTQDGVENSRR